MCHSRFYSCIGMFCALGLGPATAQSTIETARLVPHAPPASEAYFGTVRARDLFSLSYGAKGCITAVAEDAKSQRLVQAGQTLVELDDMRPQLALRTARARLEELAAAVEERELAVKAARADDVRRKQDLALVTGEFERSSVMMGRGLINESAMDDMQRRFMESQFSVERAAEAIATAEAALKRAEIAYEIGALDVQAEEINIADLSLTVPFDGVLIGFDANVGDCIQDGAEAAQIFEPDQKSVDVFFRISQLTAPEASGLAIGAPVKITRINDTECSGTITRIDAEADVESQFVETSIDVDPACAPDLFLNESVKVEAAQTSADDTYFVPNSALLDNASLFLVDEQSNSLMATQVEIIAPGPQSSLIRLSDSIDRLYVVDGMNLGDGVVLTD